MKEGCAVPRAEHAIADKAEGPQKGVSGSMRALRGTADREIPHAARTQHWEGPHGTALTLRPVRAEDHDGLDALIRSLTPRDRRWRFHGAVNALTPERLRAMVTPAPTQQIALVVVAHGPGRDALIADARCAIDASGEAAEFGLMVAPAWRRLGLGARATLALRDAAADAGLRWLHGAVLADNAPMLALVQRCGFLCTPNRRDARPRRHRTATRARAGAVVRAARRAEPRRWSLPRRRFTIASESDRHETADSKTPAPALHHAWPSCSAAAVCAASPRSASPTGWRAKASRPTSSSAAVPAPCSAPRIAAGMGSDAALRSATAALVGRADEAAALARLRATHRTAPGRFRRRLRLARRPPDRRAHHPRLRRTAARRIAHAPARGHHLRRQRPTGVADTRPAGRRAARQHGGALHLPECRDRRPAAGRRCHLRPVAARRRERRAGRDRARVPRCDATPHRPPVTARGADQHRR